MKSSLTNNKKKHDAGHADKDENDEKRLNVKKTVNTLKSRKKKNTKTRLEVSKNYD